MSSLRVRPRSRQEDARFFEGFRLLAQELHIPIVARRYNAPEGFVSVNKSAIQQDYVVSLDRLFVVFNVVVVRDCPKCGRMFTMAMESIAEKM
jgi:hypothetical protein